MKLAGSKRLNYKQELSSGSEECGNILVQGDNIDVLPELRRFFAGMIKCIYIDPPYNNGETYYYYSDNSLHDSWLQNMNRVICRLRDFLTEDGSLWISIDDREMAYLKVECDKIFGRENFVASVIWQQRKTRENRAVFSCNHEYVLVYAKNVRRFKKSRNQLPVDDGFVSKKYRNPDNDPRGPWQSVSANVQAGHGVPSQFYTITSPTGIKHLPPKGRCWIYNEERMKREIASGNIWFGSDGRNSPRVKKFLADAKIGLTPETLWLADEVGTSDSAKKQLKSLFPDEDKVFETPKPEELLKRIIEIASNEGDYVLDCFLGSGTTIATAHKMSRHYIGIEVGGQMSRLVVKRLKAVIAGEQSGISKTVKWNGGGDFAFYDFCAGNEETSLGENMSLAVSGSLPFYHSKTEQLRLALESRGRKYKVAMATNDKSKSPIARKAAMKRPKLSKTTHGKNE